MNAVIVLPEIGARTMKEPRFKFQDRVKLVDPFYGEIEGSVLGYNEIKTGIWPFRKTRKVYTVDVYFEYDGYEMNGTVVVEEQDLRGASAFSPRVIK